MLLQQEGLSDMLQIMVISNIEIQIKINECWFLAEWRSSNHKNILSYYKFTDYDYDFQEPRPRNPIHTSGEDPWLHIHKEEAARSALLFGVGVVKGVALTALVNSGNNGVTIGK